MKKKIIVFLLIIFIMALLIGAYVLRQYLKVPKNLDGSGADNNQMIIKIDKLEYEYGKDNISITIINNSDQKFCLHSCGQYIIERNNWGNWEPYPGEILCEVDFIIDCVEPGGGRTFVEETYKDYKDKIWPEKGTYRAVSRVSTGCTLSDSWPCDNTFSIYSEEFTVK